MHELPEPLPFYDLPQRGQAEKQVKKCAFPPVIPYEQAEPTACSDKQLVNILLHQASAIGSVILG